MFKFLFLFYIYSTYLFAQELVNPPVTKTLTDDEKPKKVVLYAQGDYLSVSGGTGGGSFTGFGVGFTGQYAITKKYAASLTLRQSFGSPGANASVTVLEGAVVYAFSGSLIREDKNTKLGGKTIVKTTDFGKGGWRLKMGSTHFIFNGSSLTVSYTGLTAAGYKEWTTNNDLSWYLGVQTSYISNANTSVTPIALIGGIGYWF